MDVVQTYYRRNYYNPSRQPSPEERNTVAWRLLTGVRDKLRAYNKQQKEKNLAKKPKEWFGFDIQGILKNIIKLIETMAFC